MIEPSHAPSTIILVALATPDAKHLPEIDAASWLLRAATAFADRRVLAFGAPGMRKDASLGRLFDAVQPREGNRFTIELGAILSERLPLAEGAAECMLTVRETAATNHVFCLSNVMLRLHYRKGDTDRHALCPAFALQQAYPEIARDSAGPPHVEYLPTVVTARYEIEGGDADDALSRFLESCTDDFIAGINRIVAAAVVTVDTAKSGILTPVYDRGSFPWTYLVIRGDGEAIDANVVSTSLLRSTLVAQPLDAEPFDHFQRLVDGTETADAALQAARMAASYFQAGSLDFALLLSAVAAEVATTRYVHAQLVASGVSRKKLENVERDLTFSVMLNTQLTALAPRDRQPDPALLVDIDRLRKLRNAYMHKGTATLSRTIVHTLLRATEQFVDYIRRLEAEAAGQSR